MPSVSKAMVPDEWRVASSPLLATRHYGREAKRRPTPSAGDREVAQAVVPILDRADDGAAELLRQRPVPIDVRHQDADVADQWTVRRRGVRDLFEVDLGTVPAQLHEVGLGAQQRKPKRW